ncbi:hypothetical protein GCM10022251_74100 [Phytohabitans flavus]|uniref:hypothetical protein n=1 Tax=Phytohabitans flavus TaxID=1076124 RepID=UPI0031F05C08
MTSTPVHQPPAGPDRPVTAGGVDLDADLQLALRRTSLMRQCFYIVVLVVALAGQVSGAVQALHIPVGWAIPAVVSLELGGVVVLANADVRRRLGERAAASRLLSALIAAWAVAFNWLAHDDRLLGGFFAGMSALGYLVWLTHAENQRRDRLRATGDLPPTTPAYELLGHWIRHPWLTLRAKSIAKANPRLGLYGSLSAARHEVRRERRQRSISRVLHRKIRSTVDPATADIALAVYDLDEIAVRLARQADYDTLTALIAADLAPARLAPAAAPTDLDLRPGEQNGPLPKIVAAAAAAGAAADPAPEPAAVPAPPVTAVQPPASGVPSGAPPVAPDGPNLPSDDGPPPAVYEPGSNEDTAMYAAWCKGVAAGQEPSGADLARAAGRFDDATGVGRRAARRYREAHAKARDASRSADQSASDDPTPPTAAASNGAAEPQLDNGHRLTPSGSTR